MVKPAEEEKESVEPKWLRVHVVTDKNDRYLMFSLGENGKDQEDVKEDAEEIIIALRRGNEYLKDIEVDLAIGVDGIETLASYANFDTRIMDKMRSDFVGYYDGIIFPMEFENLRMNADIGIEKRDALHFFLLKVLNSCGYCKTSIPTQKVMFDERMDKVKKMILKRAGSKVIFCGGILHSNQHFPTHMTYIFDTYDRSITRGPDMIFSREGHASATLLDGRVFICGGRGFGPGNVTSTSSCEIFNPRTMKFTRVADMHHPRTFHAAVTLLDGRVFILGSLFDTYDIAAEIYDPRTNTFTEVSAAIEYDTYYKFNVPMAAGESPFTFNKMTANLLPNGSVFIAGGLKRDGEYSNRTYTYNINSRLISHNYTHVLRSSHTATTLLDDKIFFCGGIYMSPNPRHAENEIYDPNSNTFLKTAYEYNPRMNHTASLLFDGTVFINSGQSVNNSLMTYNPFNDTYETDYVSFTLTSHAASSFF